MGKIRILSKDLKNHDGEVVLVKGHIFQKRMMGKINFLILRDKCGLIQIVIKDESQIQKINDLQDESVISVEGKCIYDERAPEEAEIRDPKIEVISTVKEPLKVEINKQEIHANIDTLLDNRPLTLRSPKIRAIFKIQSQMAKAYREYAINFGATEIFPPTIVGNATEGGSELFEIKYYDKKAYLAQSAQLYKQIMVGVFETVFSIAHSYRAEKFGTSRHMSEFSQYEWEMGFIESYMDVINTGIDIIRYIHDSVESECKDELKLIETSLPLIPKNIPIIKFRDAQILLLKEKNIDHTEEIDLSPEDERNLCEISKEKYSSDLIVITHFPSKKTAFYSMPDPENTEYTLSFDFLLQGEEILSGSQRINEYDMLIDSLKKKKLNPKNFESYTEIFKFGMPPEGGFGMGFERLTQQFLSLKNVKEASLFPRDVKRITP
jgi:nondiscriminating aspartyl-tRNA synthetase